jgi:hypothetical protein
MDVRFEPPVVNSEKPTHSVYDRMGRYSGCLKWENGALFTGYTFIPELGGSYTPETLFQIVSALDNLNGGRR